MKIVGPFAELFDTITEDDKREAARVKPISMLSAETLAAIRNVAMRTSGPVIEIGTYIGGTSILLARAISDRGNGRLICVEAGGEHLLHPQMPSRDILADWRANLFAAHLREIPTMIEGFAYLPSVIEKIKASIYPEKAGMIVIDADGFPGITLADLDGVLSSECIVIIDDYVSSSEQKELIKRQVDRLKQENSLEEMGVLPFGTWFGNMRRRVESFTLGLIFASSYGKGYCERIPIRACNEKWELFEDDREVSMRLALPDEVLTSGDGCYCLVGDDGGGFVCFAPYGNPPDLTGRQFELRRPR
jgi:hypothetical protein